MDALAQVFAGVGSDDSSGPDGWVIIVGLLVLLAVVPVVIGLLLRRRDRGSDVSDSREGRASESSPSGTFLGEWGRAGKLRRDSTRSDWLIVGVLAGVLLAAYVVTAIL